MFNLFLQPFFRFYFSSFVLVFYMFPFSNLTSFFPLFPDLLSSLDLPSGVIFLKTFLMLLLSLDLLSLRLCFFCTFFNFILCPRSTRRCPEAASCAHVLLGQRPPIKHWLCLRTCIRQLPNCMRFVSESVHNFQACTN